MASAHSAAPAIAGGLTFVTLHHSEAEQALASRHTELTAHLADQAVALQSLIQLHEQSKAITYVDAADLLPNCTAHNNSVSCVITNLGPEKWTPSFRPPTAAA